MDIYMAVVRIFHIFGGMFWLGTVWMTAVFLGPTAEAIGSDAEKFMSYITIKLRYPTIVGIAAGTNVLAGILLYWHDSGGLQLAWITTPTGLGFSFGALCALSGFILGFAAVRPTAEKLGRIGNEIHAAGKPPSSEQLANLHQVQKQLERVEEIVAVILGLALLAMATARYL
jgi:hypothetical protein